jgi:hypothetical protein
MNILILSLFLLFLTGCGGGPDMGPIGAGLCVIGLSLIVAKLVERIRGIGGDHE